MIVSCPACESRFEVDQEHLGYKGRVVRCGKCGNCWHQMPDDDPRAATAEAPGPPPRRRPAPPPKKKRGGLVVGWLLLLLLVGGVAAAGWFERQRIVAQFPQLADAYALLGIPVTPPGPMLDLKVTVGSDVVDGDTVVTVSGVISNISERKQDVPQLRAQLVDGQGQVLTEWIFDAPQSELDAGGSVEFESETRNPPAEAQNVSVFFVDNAQ